MHFISSYSAALRRHSPEATGWLPGGSPSYCLCSFCLGADASPGVGLWEVRPLDRLGFLGLGLGTDFLAVLGLWTVTRQTAPRAMTSSLPSPPFRKKVEPF